MAKRRLSALLAVILTAASLAGCANTSQPASGNAASSTVSSSVPESTESQIPSETEESVLQQSEESSKPESSDQSSSESSAKESSAKASEQSKASDVSKAQTSASTSQTSTPVQTSKPTQTSTPAQTSTPTQTSKPTQTSTPTQTSKPAETSKPTQTSKPAETSKPTQTSKPAETSKPTQTSKPAETSKPTQTSTPTETSKPSDDKKITKADSAIGDEALYKKLFDINTKVNVQITMSQSEIKKLQNDYKIHERNNDAKSEIYRKADVTITVGNEKYTIDEVGIRLKGNNTLSPFYASDGSLNISNYKLSFDETFDDKTEYGSDAKVWANENDRKLRKKRTFATLNGLDVKWNLSYDDTYIREIYATKLFEASNVLVQKINLTQLVFNGKNYGVVKIYEPIDKTFLEKRLPKEAIGGDLYKCIWAPRSGGWSGCNYQTGSTMGVQDNSAGKKYNFNLKTNKSTSKHVTLKKMLSIINKSNPTKAELESVVDTDYFARFMAASYFAGGPDDIRNNYNNHYLYFRKDNGKAIFIPYDNDRTLGITYGYNPGGNACSDRKPHTGWAIGAGQEQANNLIKLTIIENNNSTFNYVKDIYTNQLKALVKSDMMKSDSDFNKMYNTAKAHYESVVTPDVKFHNQKQNFKFSLNGTKTNGDNANWSFEQFRSAIVATFNKYVK